MKTTAQAVRIDSLSKWFDTGHGQVEALDRVSVEIAPSEFVCIVGPSGCGKTTLLNIVAGFERPSAGEVWVGGNHVKGPGSDRGFVFQTPALFPWKNVWDNVTLGPRVQGRDRREWEPQARQLLDAVGLAAFERHYPYQLSGGMAQRTQLARVLLNQPDVILMDEPFGALDFLTRLQMQTVVLDLWERYRPAIVFITHDVEEAVFLADRIYVFTPRPGRIATVIEVDLPRPRCLEVTSSLKFGTYKHRILGLLGVAKTGEAAASGGAS